MIFNFLLNKTIMAWGIFKKIKNAFKKAGDFVKNKIIKPVINTAKKVINSDTTKKLINAGVKLAPVIGAGVSTAVSGNPAEGMKIGHVVQGIGNNLGYGR